MKYTEQAINFVCAQADLIGIVATPESPRSTGVVIIVGGPQYRVGSHRQFVILSRALATAGFPVLRFDYRGMGDSSGLPRDFSTVSPDISAAIEALQAHVTSIERVALWGLCDGASAALLYCYETNNPLVAGLCVLNPWVRSEASQARARVKYYYWQRLMQKEFWAKLLQGKVAWKAISGLLANIRLMRRPSELPDTTQQHPFQHRMAIAWGKFGGDILLLLSGNDHTAKEFIEFTAMNTSWAGLLDRSNVARHDIPDADHTLSTVQSRDLVESRTLAWLQALDTK